MNRDHKKSIISTLYAQHGVKDQNVKMFKLDVDGYYAVSENKYYFLVFEKRCQSLSQYKAELIKHAKKNKKYELAKWDIFFFLYLLSAVIIQMTE